MKITTYKFSLVFLGLFVAACGYDHANSFEAHSTKQHFILAKEHDTCPASDKTPDKITKEVPVSTDSTFEDPDKEIKDFSTTFVNKEFFRTPDTLFNFLKLVYETIDNDLKEYRQNHGINDEGIFFIFKGGNVLRIVANQVLGMVPPQIRHILQDFYGDVFKRSDSDFSIIIDETQLGNLDYEKTLNEVTQLAYDSLGKIRSEITEHPEKYFNFLQIKSSIADQWLAHYLEKLKKLESINKPENPKWYQAHFAQIQFLDSKASTDLMCDFEGQFDYKFEFDPVEKNKIIGIPLTDKSHWITNTINTTLGWPWEADNQKLIKFYLVRSKVQFEYSYTKGSDTIRRPIGGELIDVSLLHRDDANLKELLHNKNLWVVDYTITLPETGASLKLKAESLEGLAGDISALILKQYGRPWAAPKYEKRLKRLFFFAIAEILGSGGSGSSVLEQYLGNLQRDILSSLNQLSEAGLNQSDIISRMAESVVNLSQQFPDFPISNDIWRGISQLISERMSANPLDDDQEKLKDFVKVIRDNVEKLEEVSQIASPRINTNDIYNADINSIF